MELFLKKKRFVFNVTLVNCEKNQKYEIIDQIVSILIITLKNVSQKLKTFTLYHGDD